MSASTNDDVVVRISARTDVGMIRRGNEDCFMVADLSTGNVGLTPEVSTHRLGDQGSLLVVSDGMGGAVAGEIASDLTVNGVREEMTRLTHLEDVSERLRHAVESTNRLVWEHTQANPQLSGMGATLTAVLCHEGKAYVAQVGDSRAYLVRSGRIKQLTKDQSLVQLLMDAGAIRPEQANQVPNNVILQALGTRPEVVVAMMSVELCSNDFILLCSDGLSNKVNADEMRDATLRNGTDLAGACRQLIELANARGGEDNITALLARFDGTSLQSAAEQRSITASLHEITSNDLLRIGGAQLDYYHDAASDVVVPTPNVDLALENLGVTLVHPQANPAVEDVPITQVAIPVLPPRPAAPPPAPLPPLSPPPQYAYPMPEVVVPVVNTGALAPPRSAGAPSTPSPAGGPSTLLLLLGLLLVFLALAGGLAFGLYWWFFLRQAA